MKDKISITQLETKIDELIALCHTLKEERENLRQQLKVFHNDYSELKNKHNRVVTSIEKTVKKLKNRVEKINE